MRTKLKPGMKVRVILKGDNNKPFGSGHDHPVGSIVTLKKFHSYDDTNTYSWFHQSGVYGHWETDCMWNFYEHELQIVERVKTGFAKFMESHSL